jgi:hypothetical protein
MNGDGVRVEDRERAKKRQSNSREPDAGALVTTARAIRCNPAEVLAELTGTLSAFRLAQGTTRTEEARR